MAMEHQSDDPGVTAGVLDAARLRARLPGLRAEYAAARPWPHVVVRDVFPAALLDEVVSEVDTFDRTAMVSAQTRNMVKRETPEAERVGPATRAVLETMSSAPFVSFVGAILGIPDLEPDPERFWAGVHETPTGGFTMVHTDFDTHPTTGLYHRSNVLLYLNRDWQEAWGGSLELWPPDMSAVGRRIVPSFNTLVIFETHATTFHGLPDPVDAPGGRSRLSLAAYQFSPTPASVTASARWSKYVRRPGDRWTVGLPSHWDLRNHLPAPVRRAGRLLRDRLGRASTAR